MTGPIHHWAYGDDGKTIAVTSSGNALVTIDKETGQVSDGFHTFEELYRYRLLYNAALFNQWYDGSTSEVYGPGYEVHKSWRHHDGGLCFGGGWFIVMATLPTGQISNHYPQKDWDLFQIPERDRADEWDGHTPDEAADRLESFLRSQP